MSENKNLCQRCGRVLQEINELLCVCDECKSCQGCGGALKYWYEIKDTLCDACHKLTRCSKCNTENDTFVPWQGFGSEIQNICPKCRAQPELWCYYCKRLAETRVSAFTRLLNISTALCCGVILLNPQRCSLHAGNKTWRMVDGQLVSSE